ncbi:hypothetical protein [Natranaerofaba carboxydovora]|uniref:hypothetical protein n=1 Tax=Natranaerofaba carboxydovora TaxID=2742683 RepID=UPI001F141F43|nr:hypothetical protein [Natranaerofaba carboxydovora]UMZ72574.1 hypothetical protein ACONDI_00098 [Natranaerofaba carboxydovora]
MIDSIKNLLNERLGLRLMVMLIFISLVIFSGNFVISKFWLSVAEADGQKEPFGEKDIEAVGVEIGMESEDIKNNLGTPKSIEMFNYRLGEGEIWEYEFGELILYYWEDNIILNNIIVNKPGFEGPRDIQVGDHKDEVINRFLQDGSNSSANTKDLPSTKTLYGDSAHNSTGGTIYYDEDGIVDKIIYVKANSGEWPYALIIDFNEQEKVNSFTINVEVI